METKHGNEQKTAVALSEFLGTMFLSLTANILWTDGNLSFFLILTMGCCLFVLYNIFGPISNGHFNPAVSVAVYLSLALNVHNSAMLMIILLSQLCGALVGMLLSRTLRL